MNDLNKLEMLVNSFLKVGASGNVTNTQVLFTNLQTFVNLVFVKIVPLISPQTDASPEDILNSLNHEFKELL